MLRIYYSNQLNIHKKLISKLIKNKPLIEPFEKEIILTQNIGMSQWLQIELAKILSITANISFLIPQDFIWNIFTKTFDNLTKDNIFSKKSITWELMIIIPLLLHKNEFKHLNQYLYKDQNKRKLYQLSTNIASLFYKYLIYRPELIESWNNKQLISGLSYHQKWQKMLWLELINHTKKNNKYIYHFANLYKNFINNFNINLNSYINLPKRIFICGITTLPPVYLNIFNVLSNYIDIYLMFTNPCYYNWYNIQKNSLFIEKKIYKLKYNKKINLNIKKTVNFLNNYKNKQFIINPLLNSWGKIGSDNLYYLSKLKQSKKNTKFINLTRYLLLHQIQQDILSSENYVQLSLIKNNYNHNSLKRKIIKQDKSLTFHSCYSQQREIEVLQDYLLKLFEENKYLTPKDIIVMAVDINSYVPYIQAVFNDITIKHRLPFFISEKKDKKTTSIFKSFILLLNLSKIRCTIEEVISLLEIPEISNQFLIDDNELILLKEWISESGIRWGINDKDIIMLGLPIVGQNTWDFGFKRILLGYAMDSSEGTWNKILPYDKCIGLSAQIIGKLIKFINSLIDLRNKINKEKTLLEWLPLGQYILDVFFKINEQNEKIFIFIIKQWQKIIKYGITANYKDIIPLSIINDELIICFNNKKFNEYFITGAINFCKITSMRSIPFKVICLLGMNDGIFPRITKSLGFDLIAEKPQRGDKQRKNDDKYIFLESLTSASQIFYISYIGYNIQNNQICNPSILVNELLNYISQSFYIQGDEYLNIDISANKVKEYLITKHEPISFTSKNYLTNNINQNYNNKWFLKNKKNNNLQFISHKPLNNIIGYNSIIFLDKLLSFYHHPIRFFFQKRLKINFFYEKLTFPKDENFTVNNLQQYKYNKKILNAMIYGESLDKILNNLLATGELPAKNFGHIYLEKQIQILKPLAEKIKKNSHEYLDKKFIEYFDNTSLVGKLFSIQQNGIIRYRPAKLTINDGLSLWIEHLIFCLINNCGESYYWGKNNSEWGFKSVNKNQAKIYLQILINGYQNGINSPLPLFAKSGWNWLISCYDKKNNQFIFNSKLILQKAKTILINSLKGTYSYPGEIKDDYNYRVFNKIDNNLIKIIQKKALTYLLPIAKYKK